MKTMYKLVALLGFAMMIGILAPAALAQSPEASTFSISEPLDVGGTVLQPGTYTIRVLPNFQTREQIQITSTDLQTVYATVLAVPHVRMFNEKVPATEFIYFPADTDHPRALRTWFAKDAASAGGHDIVYEEGRAKLLAKTANTNVIAYQGTDIGSAELRTVTPQQTVEVYTPPAPAVVPPPAPVQIAETHTEMPHTAGNMPLFALLGLVAIAGAVSIRMFLR